MDVSLVLNLSARERIIARSRVEDRGFTSPCWISDRAQNGDGYTRLTYEGRPHSTHRFSYEAFVGAIPSGMVLDHLCSQRACCNPSHLEPVTMRENGMRGDTVQARNAAKTHCKNGHPLAGDNLIPANLKQGRRGCRTCSIERARATRRARKVATDER